MARISRQALSFKDFSNLTKPQQVKELQKMTKRANVRLKLQEDKQLYNKAYKDTYEFNTSIGREKNRFYEGKNYKTKDDIVQAFKGVQSYLTDKGSTLTGAKKGIVDDVKLKFKTDTLDMKYLKSLSLQERAYASQYLGQLSNQRLKSLEKAGIKHFAYAKAEKYNVDDEGRKNNRFYTGTKFKTGNDINRQLENEIYFLNAKTSTPSGLKQIYKERIDTFRDKGVSIPQGQEKEFMDFLSSKQFENLSKYADSNQVIQTYADARSLGEDVDKINKEFNNFMNTNVTFDVVQERLKVAKWQGRLFK